MPVTHCRIFRIDSSLLSSYTHRLSLASETQCKCLWSGKYFPTNDLCAKYFRPPPPLTKFFLGSQRIRENVHLDRPTVQRSFGDMYAGGGPVNFLGGTTVGEDHLQGADSACDSLEMAPRIFSGDRYRASRPGRGSLRTFSGGG